MRIAQGHGTRANYLHRKCRCVPCRKANRDYCAERRRSNPHPNGLVSAKTARGHLRKLLRRGVGVRSVSAVIEMKYGHLSRIRRGVVATIRRSTEQLILSVSADACADSAKISSNKTVGMVNRLRREGFTNERLAVQLDFWPETIHRLAKRKYVLASTQMRVEKFYNRVMAEAV